MKLLRLLSLALLAGCAAPITIPPVTFSGAYTLPDGSGEVSVSTTIPAHTISARTLRDK